jgi:hypothetical protein
MDEKSGMTGDCHVPFCGSPGVRFPRATRHPRPFTWTATADEILAKVKVVEANVRKLVDNNAK